MGIVAGGLAGLFWKSVAQHSQRPAIELPDQTLTYAELGLLVASLAKSLREQNTGSNFVGLYANRGLGGVVGALGILSAGKTIVPLNPKFAVDRTAFMINEVGLRTIVMGSEPSSEQRGLQSAFGKANLVRVPKAVSAPLPLGEVLRTPAAPHAYLLFTSEITDESEAVAIPHRRALAYFANIESMLSLTPNDRCSQACDLTADFSIHDVFATMSRGACLVPLNEEDLQAPSPFIRERALTSWFSAPEVARSLWASGALKPAEFPALRWSLFCGGKLPAASSEAWRLAAPNSRVFNLYGTTEATIAFTSYEWTGRENVESLRMGLVPIGRPFPGQATLVWPEGAAEPVPAAPATGELLLYGSQVAEGYWANRKQSREKFVNIKNLNLGPWYRTGHQVERDEDGNLHFLGRIER